MGPWAFGVPLVSTLGLLLNGYVLLVVLGLGKQVNSNEQISIPCSCFARETLLSVFFFSILHRKFGRIVPFAAFILQIRIVSEARSRN